MAPPKIQIKLADKPRWPTTYAVASREYRKQVAALLDKMTTSKAASVQAAVHDPSHIKWEFVLDRAKDPPDTLVTPQEISRYFVENSQVYLKATAGGNAGGRFIGFEPIDQPPATIQALFEQRANLLSGQREADDREEEEDASQGLLAFREPPEESLVGFYDRWYAMHPTADKRLYYIGREVVKHLMESTSDKRRVK